MAPINDPCICRYSSVSYAHGKYVTRGCYIEMWYAIIRMLFIVIFTDNSFYLVHDNRITDCNC